MNYSDYIIYADESGDPNPAPIDANYPVFALNFCVFPKDHYAVSALPAVTAFKFAHFGHDDYSVNLEKAGIGAMEFGSGVVGTEPPVDRDARGAAPRFVGRVFSSICQCTLD